jgi:autotransporter-associated beta strand protein
VLSLTGSLALGDATNNGALTLSGNTTLTGATTLTVASAATLGGIVSGAFDLVKEGAAELTFAGVNTFSGTTTINGGTLTLAGGNALVNSMAVTVNASGLLKLVNSEEIAMLAGTGAANLQGNVLTVSGDTDTTFSGIFSGAGGALVKNGSAVFTLGGTNSFGGGVTLNAGAIQVGTDLALGTGTLTFTGGRLSSDSATDRTLGNALSLTGTLALGDATNNGALSLGGNATLTGATTLTLASAATLGGIVSGGFDLVKDGTAELTLSGANTFSGTTTVNGGTLTLAGGNALANSMAVTVNASGHSHQN